MKRTLFCIFLFFILATSNAQTPYAGLSLGYSSAFGSTDISAYFGSNSLFEQPLGLRGQVDLNVFIPGITLGAGADLMYNMALEPLTLYLGAGPNVFFVPGAETTVFAFGAHATTGLRFDLDFISLFAEAQPSFFLIPLETASPSAGANTRIKVGVLVTF